MHTSLPGFAHPLDELRDEFDRFWGTLAAAPPLHGRGNPPPTASFPAVNVRETDDALMPPARSGAKGNGQRQPAVTWHRRERGTGSFERRIRLPVAIDAARVEARLADGVLTVTCPKAPEAQPHKVQVRSA
jgi:HSP20 family molecular chaperone IbpA